MKKISLFFLFVIFISTILFADGSITRGPDIGEIYFIGIHPTMTDEKAIYHSTDFGETTICVDCINMVAIICADITTGSIYKIDHSTNMFYSDNYGQYGSWVFRTSEGSYRLASGRNEGEIYKGIGRSSNNYGLSFTQHSCQGFFGELMNFDIDNENDVGYTIVSQYTVDDSLWLLISYDNYENLEIQHVFDFDAATIRLTRDYSDGELYLYTYSGGPVGNGKKLMYSNDYGITWELKNEFNCPNLPIKGIVGGRQPGELFMNVEYRQLLCTIAHTYIYHSMDNGETFTIYHPFSYGPEPYIANFEASPTSGPAPLTVQFTDLSTGPNVGYWMWDFDNDWFIDSYEQNPEYTYQDTGYYSVTLWLWPDDPNPARRFNYIHVTDSSFCDDEQIENTEKIILNNSPNPFNPSTIINYELPVYINEANIEIYNVLGQKIKEFDVTLSPSQQLRTGLAKGYIVWDGKDSYDIPVSSGIYLYKLNIKNSPIKKMILLK